MIAEVFHQSIVLQSHTELVVLTLVILLLGNHFLFVGRDSLHTLLNNERRRGVRRSLRIVPKDLVLFGESLDKIQLLIVRWAETLVVVGLEGSVANSESRRQNEFTLIWANAGRASMSYMQLVSLHTSHSRRKIITWQNYQRPPILHRHPRPLPRRHLHRPHPPTSR